MAQQVHSYEDVVDSNEESTKIKQLIDIAFQELDDSFIPFKTHHSNLELAYKTAGNDNFCTARGVTMMDDVTKLDDYYKSLQKGFEDVLIDHREADKSITECRVVKCIDDDHQIVYQSNKSGFRIVAPRDTNFMATRFKFENYANNQRIVGHLGYSINEDHPFYVPPKEKHVRVSTASGIVLSVANGDTNNKVRVCQIVSVDVGGSVPKWITNKVIPKQGERAKMFAEEFDKLEERLKKREKNNFKQDYQPLFTQKNGC